MLVPDAARAELRATWTRQRGNWLAGNGDWPRKVSLHPPTEAHAAAEWEDFSRWLKQWRDVGEPGRVEPLARRWPRLGVQTLPWRWWLDTPADVAEAIGEGSGWTRATHRARDLLTRWPHMAAVAARLRRNYRALADWPQTEFQRLVDVVAWLQEHPDSGLYLRQLPIAGIDSKWIEKRRGVVADLLSGVLGFAGRHGLEDLVALRTAPDRVRLRLLDSALRAALDGLEDLTVPVTQVAAMQLPVRQVLIVENRETGLASEDLPGTLVLMARGYAVSYVERIPWLQPLPLYYWGDIDTHGLAILDRLRRHAPKVVSLLMDEQTLHATPRDLWASEAKPHDADAEELDALTDAERDFYARLRSGRFGPAPRLEQERIAWDYAWPRIRAALAENASSPA
ncbi:DUF2220 family protein [Xanthomonas campestris pv. phormiicola]|nr:DUF2220 family protein [Xanthomonas campestris pv. phormiicola]UYC16562.1 DUF2220 family protein [Xanthomonas campestris pv. phormiicola]